MPGGNRNKIKFPVTCRKLVLNSPLDRIVLVLEQVR